MQSMTYKDDIDFWCDDVKTASKGRMKTFYQSVFTIDLPLYLTGTVFQFRDYANGSQLSSFHIYNPLTYHGEQYQDL